MRAVAMFPTEKKIRLVDRPRPRLEGDDQARIRMLEVGVCGTDRGSRASSTGCRPPASRIWSWATSRSPRSSRSAAPSRTSNLAIWWSRRCGAPAANPSADLAPPQPARLLPHRCLHRARYHAPTWLHDGRGGRSGEQHAPRASVDCRHRGPHRAAHHCRKGAHRARVRSGPDALGQPGQGGEAGDERGGPRRGASRPARCAGAPGAGLRHLDLLARERQQPARRLGGQESGPATSSRGSFRSATSASRWGTSISSTRRPARRLWPSPRSRRSARTASSSSPAFRATRPPSRSTPSRSCAIWCSRISSSTGR